MGIMTLGSQEGVVGGLSWCFKQLQAHSWSRVPRNLWSESSIYHRQGELPFLSPPLDVEHWFLPSLLSKRPLTVAPQWDLWHEVSCGPSASFSHVYVHAQLLSYVWLSCNPMDYSPPGSYVHGFSQPRILEWIAICSFRGSSRSWDPTHHVPCIGKQILYHWTTREALLPLGQPVKNPHIFKIWALSNSTSAHSDWLCLFSC